MFRNPSIEGIGRQVYVALEELKILFWDNEVQKSLFLTNRTVAILHLEGFNPNLESDCTTVTATLEGFCTTHLQQPQPV